MGSAFGWFARSGFSGRAEVADVWADRHDLAMRIKDYVFGQKRVLHSPLSREEVCTRINRASGSVLNPFGTGVAGWARFGRISLRIQRGPFDYNAKPLLSGCVYEIPGGAEIYTKYGASIWTIFFFVFWYMFILLISITMAVIFLTGDAGVNWDAMPFGILVVVVLLIVPIIMHIVGTRESESELDEILTFLNREVLANILPSYSPDDQHG